MSHCAEVPELPWHHVADVLGGSREGWKWTPLAPRPYCGVWLFMDPPPPAPSLSAYCSHTYIHPVHHRNITHPTLCVGCFVESVPNPRSTAYTCNRKSCKLLAPTMAVYFCRSRCFLLIVLASCTMWQPVLCIRHEDAMGHFTDQAAAAAMVSHSSDVVTADDVTPLWYPRFTIDFNETTKIVSTTHTNGRCVRAHRAPPRPRTAPQHAYIRAP